MNPPPGTAPGARRGKSAAPALRIGTSGYQYDHWRDVFYPRDLPKARWFAYYAGHFDTVEINNTFYRLPEAHTFRAWREQAPPGFCYAVKFSRYGTHRKRLKDPEEPLQRFTSRAQHLGPFLGPVLVQLPPRFRVNPERLQRFLAAAPATWRWAVEFRDPSWLCEEVFALLRRYGAALCVHDLIQGHPRELTAGFAYLRYHGGREHGGNYSRRYLRAEAGRLAEWLQAGVDVFAYFNNDPHGYAIANAAVLLRYVRPEQNARRRA